MTKGKVKKSVRLALNEFDKWNNVAGLVSDDTGYYYEIQGVIEDAVHIGIQMALYGNVEYNEDGEVAKNRTE